MIYPETLEFFCSGFCVIKLTDNEKCGSVIFGKERVTFSDPLDNKWFCWHRAEQTEEENMSPFRLAVN